MRRECRWEWCLLFIAIRDVIKEEGANGKTWDYGLRSNCVG
jgi:hypothetical protein